MPLSRAPGMGWSNFSSSTCLLINVTVKHGAQKVKPILLSPLYTLRVNDTNTNIIQCYIDALWSSWQPDNSYCNRPPHTPIFFFPFSFFGRNAFFFWSYKLIVLYTLQLRHTTVHVLRNTKMYCQASHPRMKNPPIGYVSKLRFPASHNAHLSIPVSIPYISPNTPFLFFFVSLIWTKKFDS